VTTDFNKELRRHTQDIRDKAFKKYKTKNFRSQKGLMASKSNAKMNFKNRNFWKNIMKQFRFNFLNFYTLICCGALNEFLSQT